MIDGVPTTLDLIEMSKGEKEPYAVVIERTTKGAPSKFRITDRGHALLGKKLREASGRNGPITPERARQIIDEGKAAAAADPKKQNRKKSNDVHD